MRCSARKVSGLTCAHSHKLIHKVRRREVTTFRSPFGPLGRLVDALIMRRHLIAVITERNDAISAHFD